MLRHGALAAFAILVACPGAEAPVDAGPGEPDAGVNVDAGQPSECDADDDCIVPGLVCVDGTCRAATCDPQLLDACRIDGLESPLCCAPVERCSDDLQCELDPEVAGVIGCAAGDDDCAPCELDDDCSGGEFCTGGTCESAAAAAACTTSFDCPPGERCDRTVFLCVEDRGGCQLCGDVFPELCCEDDQLCAAEIGGFCVEAEDPECAIDTDCAPGEPFCHPVARQCVECVVDDDCGPGLSCAESSGTCFSIPQLCEGDDECDGDRRCVVETGHCITPECESDGDCAENPDFDTRYRCDLDDFSCFLPPAVCAGDDDEPNDTIAEATLLEGSFAAGLLCREDVDVWMFAVIPERRYEVTVDFAASGNAGVVVSLFNTDEIIESVAIFNEAQASAVVVGVTAADESGFFFVTIQGGNDEVDSRNYVIAVVEEVDP